MGMQPLRPTRALALALVLPLTLILPTACGGADDADHEHAHTAPRGGLLVELAEHEAHAELLFDAETGAVTMYLLGAHAENPLRSAQEAIDLQIDELGDSGGPLTLPLLPVASDLTGESPGDTSRFEAAAPALAGAESFAGRIGLVQLRGASYADVAFSWPLVDDHGHDHAEGDGHDH